MARCAAQQPWQRLPVAHQGPFHTGVDHVAHRPSRRNALHYVFDC